MLKSPISVLQELAVQRRLPIPDYEISGSGQPHCMAFTCIAKIGNEKSVGTGVTKKDAKHDAASRLLERFGVKMDNTRQMSNICLLPIKTEKSFPGINYVGKLNEFSSQHQFPYPSYIDDAILFDNRFCIICQCQQFQSEGYGSTKKEAKQDAARKMLTIVKDNKLDVITSTSKLNVITEPSNEQFDSILQTYTDIMKNLSISNTAQSTSNNSVNSQTNSYVDISNWDELVEYMNNQGWKYEVTVFQQEPLMLCLKINEQTLINLGQSRNEIYQKLANNVVMMLAEGIDFNAPLISL